VRPCDLFSNATAEIWFYLRTTKKLSGLQSVKREARYGLEVAEETNDLEVLMICPPCADTEIRWGEMLLKKMGQALDRVAGDWPRNTG
jgi:hypothetical protein